jgi:hypothetical protein
VANTLSLTTPIKAHGEMVSELTFREPLGKDIRVLGFPFEGSGENGKGRGSVDAAGVSRYIVTLANVPLSSVDQLSAPDWTAAMGLVAGFFADTEPSSSTATSTQPTSGAMSSTSSD